tara:strand:+ start:313 stop:471 length:159 start_codon:yes stop_codon:yes gene_type:complete
MLKKTLFIGGILVNSVAYVHVLLIDNNKINFKYGRIKELCPVMEYIRCMKHD